MDMHAVELATWGLHLGLLLSCFATGCGRIGTPSFNLCATNLQITPVISSESIASHTRDGSGIAHSTLYEPNRRSILFSKHLE